jgi:hypothetical protein
MTAKPYPEGIDCEWLGLDGHGHVAAFVTAGCGPIPAQLLEAEPCWLDLLDEQFDKLPRTCAARLLEPLKRPDDFVDIAERGIFVYDWSDVHRAGKDRINAYELIAVPSNPIDVSQLPHDLAALAASSRLADVAFETAKRIDVRQSLGCVEGR